MKPYNKANRTKSEEIQEMFDRIAPRYDLLNHTLSAGIDKLWRRRVVKMVRQLRPSAILDVATGTGDLALAFARKIEGVKVVGADLSSGMLEQAREKIGRAKLKGEVELICCAAESMPMLPDGGFDVATVAFGVRNFGDLEQGIREMCRTLRKGGTLLILEFSTPTHPLIRAPYRWYSRHILPRIGGAVSKERSAYEYLPQSVEEFLQPPQMIALLERIGLQEARAHSLSFGIAQIYTARKAE
jgi:demethylmenaquinone methyltransferase/2-methoxy-6-polyprenyl-1,4-benzoquinol methylase